MKGNRKVRSRTTLFWLGCVVVLVMANLLPESLAQSVAEAESFRQIDQPWRVKAIVTATASGLIGLELWWFMMGKSND